MSISSITKKPIDFMVKKSSPFFSKLAERPYIAAKLNESITDPARFTAKMLVFSIVTKDLVNCFLYTYQSWNNKKIPEDKRKFVAMVDAMNGIVMVGGQIFAGRVIDQKVIPKIKSLFTGTIKDANGKNKNSGKDATTKIFHDDNLKNIAANVAHKLGITNCNLDKVVKGVAKKTRDPFIEGLGIIITTLATTAFVKRMIAPLISTPLAGIINDEFLKEKVDPKTDNRMTYEWVALSSTKYNHPETAEPKKNA